MFLRLALYAHLLFNTVGVALQNRSFFNNSAHFDMLLQFLAYYRCTVTAEIFVFFFFFTVLPPELRPKTGFIRGILFGLVVAAMGYVIDV